MGTTYHSLGDRMKDYERAARSALPRRLPVILRLDGKAFHTYTRGLARPFSAPLGAAMNAAAVRVCEEAQGAVFAYVQSDEISVLLHNYRRLESDAWFDNQVMKMVSVAASLAAAHLTARSGELFGEIRPAAFDARVFVLPESEVANYFLWRQQDWIRNSVQMLALSLYTQKECHARPVPALEAMIREKGQDWSALPAALRLGRAVVRRAFEREGVARHAWVVDEAPPRFADDRGYVERWLAREDGDSADDRDRAG